VADGEIGSAAGWEAERVAGSEADRVADWAPGFAAWGVACLDARELAGRGADARLADFDIT
jgi:hypothetical protein